MTIPVQDPNSREKTQASRAEKSSAVVKTVQDLISAYEQLESFTYQKDLTGGVLEIRIKMSNWIG